MFSPTDGCMMFFPTDSCVEFSTTDSRVMFFPTNGCVTFSPIDGCGTFFPTDSCVMFSTADGCVEFSPIDGCVIFSPTDGCETFFPTDSRVMISPTDGCITYFSLCDCCYRSSVFKILLRSLSVEANLETSHIIAALNIRTFGGRKPIFHQNITVWHTVLVWGSSNTSQRSRVRGWWDGSVGKEICHQACQPKFDPYDPHGRKRINSHKLYLWLLHVHHDMFVYTHTQINKVILKLLMLKEKIHIWKCNVE